MSETETPITDEIVAYMNYQFPATVGHIPLREKIKSLELKNNELRKALEGKLTDKAMSAMINAYEDAMGGDRLPDGDGYDYEVVETMFKAALSTI